MNTRLLATGTVIVADDQAVARSGVRLLLQAAAPNLKIVAEAACATEAVKLAERFQPDVLITDLSMPETSGPDAWPWGQPRAGGLTVARQVSQKVPSTRVVIYSMHAIEFYAIEAFRAGAMGYVVKQASDDNDLIRTMSEVLEGRRFLSAPLSQRVFEAYAVRTGAKPCDPYHTLSVREREFLALFARGATYEEIAARLNVSTDTVKYHRTDLGRKLALRSREDLVRYAVAHGLIDPTAF
jgi:DNA-binding NarL/FixJ family response regulator